MTHLQFEVPTLIKQVMIDGEPGFQFAPVFLPAPDVTEIRYETAFINYKKAIKHFFDKITFSGDKAQKLAWLWFSPSVRYIRYHFSFKSGKDFYSGPFEAVHFELQEREYLCFPALGRFIAMLSPDVPVLVQMEDILKKVLKANDTEGLTEEMDVNYYAPEKSNIKNIPIDLHIDQPGFAFETDTTTDFFAEAYKNQVFSGSEEIGKVGFALNDLYPVNLHRAWFRDAMVENLNALLLKSKVTPLVLVGPIGSGRHTLVHEMLYRYMNTFEADMLWQAVKIWHIDPSRIIAGMSVVGNWEKRFEAILDFLQTGGAEETPPGVLLIDNPVALLSIGKSAGSQMTLSSVLKTYLEQRTLRIVLVATQEEWHIIQQHDRAFADLFQLMRIPRPNSLTATKMVLKKRNILESRHGCSFSVQAIGALLDFQRKYLGQKALPGSVVQLMEQLAVKHQNGLIELPEATAALENISGFHQQSDLGYDSWDNENLLSKLQKKLVGQPEAVQVLADTLQLLKSQLRRPGKPIATYLFTGPTGVGKTEAAKLLAQHVSGHSDKLIRFDMNEFLEGTAVSRLIGAPGNGEGLLTAKVRYQPFGVLLLDEIEKAHPDVHDLLLQLLDEGRLTNAGGITVDFSNIVIILTSNFGAEAAAHTLGFDKSGHKNQQLIYENAIKKFFRPELLNRIDRMVVFRSLEFDQIQHIARLQINQLLQREGFLQRTTILNVAPDALGWVARRGYDRAMGGRALKRQIEQDLTALSAERLLENTADQPLIFNIYLDGNQLASSVTTLSFIPALPSGWIPEIPDEMGGKQFLKKLLNKTLQLEKRLESNENMTDRATEKIEVLSGEEAEFQWKYYDLQRRLAELRDALQNLLLGYGDKFYKKAPVFPLRLKKVSFPQEGYIEKNYRDKIKDIHYQKENIEEIQEQFKFSAAVFNMLQSEFLDKYLDLQFNAVALEGLLSGDMGKLEFQLKSGVRGRGQSALNYLFDLYLSFFDRMDIKYKADKAHFTIHLDGLGLRQLMQGECGIHLFVSEKKAAVPIRVQILSQTDRKPATRNTIVRIYEANLINDLKTTLFCPMREAEKELKLLIAGTAASPFV